ncbi:MAG: cyclic peptide export ABC transporter [Rhodospirillaceae bacterium]
MALGRFIMRASPRQLGTIGGLALLSGVANAILVIVISKAAEHVADGQPPGVAAWLVFGGAFVVYYLGNQYALVRSVVVIEELLNRLRTDLVDKLRRTELLVADRLGRGRLYSMVATETNHLSVSFPLVVDAVQQAILLAAALVYLLYLSPAAFGIFVLSVFAGLIGCVVIDRRFREIQRLVGKTQARMLDAVADIIHGGKELRLNRRRSDAVDRAVRKLSRNLEGMQLRSADQWSSLILLSSVVTYAMLGMVGFLFPPFVDGHHMIVFQVIPVLLLCMGTVTKILSISPMFVRAEVGLQAILTVDRELAAAGGVSPEVARTEAPAFREFREIRYCGIGFSYRSPEGEETYTAGPLDLTLQKGEVVFLVGGNGSGKSTAMRMMTGLLPCETGDIHVDGRLVSRSGFAGFRELFSAIFVDFHLFDRLYGLEGVDPDEVNRLIDEMGLAGKVRFEDGRFSRLHLSTGQRKRLALIAALMEDRPVYVFDEWSAEQDVQFRSYFYEKVIPDLRAKGKLVIAATHDERYWKAADRVIKLDLGRIEWDRPPAELDGI